MSARSARPISRSSAASSCVSVVSRCSRASILCFASASFSLFAFDSV
jgi:hypothetical protein